MNSGIIIWSEIISDFELVMMYKTHSLKQMDKILGVSRQTITRKLLNLGVTLRGRGGPNHIKH